MVLLGLAPELQSKYIDYNRNAIEIHGVLFATVHSNGWTAEKCRFLVVEKKRCLLGLDLHNRVGIVTKQLRGPDLKSKIQVNDVQESETTKELAVWRNYFQLKYPDIFTRQGISKNHVVNVQFFEKLIPVQEKGRRVPIHILDRVENEIENLLLTDHIEKLDSCTDDVFIAPIVLTAKKDGSIKLALDAKPVNAQINKNKYQMPVLDELMDSVSRGRQGRPGLVYLP